MVTLTLDRLTAHYGRRQILSEITTPPLEGGRVVALLGPTPPASPHSFGASSG
nr:hypothetical protein [Halomonas elongata]